eukprot:CAMPEP_0118693170 /NCGR_PEP_ID=MMETSP0800-20121206/11749_1 /TAXON_ID=210618 ORGANISM="Striatella unipunctata, Strain CCMP2910" /NCGR_SAMPLE_ID=MMETSP0800 /ASSEMBLY_ACC=CAM_ASM_000638 /LENGTH=146 /DNA_ID=CAMNT_0006591355 /DNA_START=35 /DNA_END=475 /DNA_ORIENTATION=-
MMKLVAVLVLVLCSSVSFSNAFVVQPSSSFSSSRIARTTKTTTTTTTTTIWSTPPPEEQKSIHSFVEGDSFHDLADELDALGGDPSFLDDEPPAAVEDESKNVFVKVDSGGWAPIEAKPKKETEKFEWDGEVVEGIHFDEYFDGDH